MTELVPLPNFRTVISEAIKYWYLKDLCEIVIRECESISIKYCHRLAFNTSIRYTF